MLIVSYSKNDYTTSAIQDGLCLRLKPYFLKRDLYYDKKLKQTIEQLSYNAPLSLASKLVRNDPAIQFSWQ